MVWSVNIAIGIDAPTRAWLSGLTARFGSKLDLILANQEKIMASLDDVLSDITAETDAISSVSTLITGLKQQLADALSGTTLPPATQAKVDQIFAAAEANKAALATAILANTPEEPPAA